MAKEDKDKSKQEIQQATPARNLSPFEEMDRLFDHYFSRRWLHPLDFEFPAFKGKMAPFEGKTPNVDIIDRDNEIVVKAELPGVEKKDLDISVTRNSVTIKGSTHHEKKEENEKFYHSEISRGEYSRTLNLPSDVDETKASANFKDGVLELTLPKMEKTKRHSVKVE